MDALSGGQTSKGFGQGPEGRLLCFGQGPEGRFWSSALGFGQQSEDIFCQFWSLLSQFSFVAFLFFHARVPKGGERY